MGFRIGCSVFLVIALGVGLGCRRKGTPQPAHPDVSRTVTKGPVTMRVTLTSDRIDLNQRDHLSIEIDAPIGVTVHDPDYHDVPAVGDHRFEYQVVPVDSRTVQNKKEGKRRWRYDYDLTFFLPGEYELPPVEVTFSQPEEPDRGTNAASGAASVPGESRIKLDGPIRVVAQPLSAKPMSEAELRTIHRLDPVELPSPWRPWWMVAMLLVIGAAVLIFLRLRRRRKEVEDVVIEVPAHEWARGRLAELIAENLVARGLLREYHYRISDIVRGYVERRFHVSAPEMTTEEFLQKASNDPRLIGRIADELARFLTACDLVKYARYEPGEEDANTLLSAAGDFVERTRAPTAMETEQDTGSVAHRERVA